MDIRPLLCCLVLGFALAPAAPSRDDVDGFVYAVVRFDELELRDAADLPAGLPAGGRTELVSAPRPDFLWISGRFGRRADIGDFVRHPRAVLDGPGDAVAWFGDWREGRAFPTSSQGRLAVRLREARDATGVVFVPAPEADAQLAVPFVVRADAFGADSGAWRDVVADRARLLADLGVGGAAWFRSQHAAWTLDGEDDRPAFVREAVADLPSAELDETFGFVSGGRAISENLALDRVLPFGDDADATVPIDSIRGVETRPYEWGALVDGLSPALDPLAVCVPHDQHALFFPSTAALGDVARRLDPVLASVGRLEAGAAARTLARYERQLGLSIDGLDALGERVASVAITGGDPALRTGADVAVLFELPDDAARDALRAFVDAAFDEPGVDDSAAGQDFTAYENADRSVCAYVATVDGVVVVTNSVAQLERVVGAARGELTSLDELDEYAFFRDRYRRDDAQESALLVLSDATIRRWGGPRVRIGASRRARAAAVLGELTARFVDGRLDVTDDVFATAADLPDVGVVSHVDGALVSSSYGSLAFATPVAELDLERVTDEERDAYTRWRDGYERNWRVFDPIAVRVDVADDHVALDTTVRPLMLDSEYDDYVRITAGSAIAPRAGDLHDEAALHFAIALSPDLLAASSGASMLDMMSSGVDLRSWLGSSATLYVDADERWKEHLAEGAWSIYDVFDMPIGLQLEVTSGLRLVAFLAGMRAFAEQSAPGMTTWESREHAGYGYVRIGAPDLAVDESATYYVTTPGSLTISPSEEVVQRAIDRHLARVAAREAGEPEPQQSFTPWPGEHVGWRVDVARAVEYAAVSMRDLRGMARRASWRNLPILNEWRRRFADEHPLDLHERLFARRLTDPTGGRYVWNDTWQTYESTAWGHPGAPFPGPDPTTWFGEWLTDFTTVSAGVTFEDDGLRAKVRAETRDG